MTTQMNRGIKWTDSQGNEMIISRDIWRAEVLPRALADHWNKAELLFLDVMMGIEDGFREEMLPFAKRLLTLEGESERAVTCLAYIQINTGKVEDAKAALDRYLATHPPCIRILYTLAQAHKETGELDALRKTLRQALLLDPNEPSILDWWYTFHKDTSGEARAEKALREVAEERGSWLAEVWLSLTLLQDRKIDEAIAIYRRILGTAAHQGLALQEISGHLGQAGYYQEALDLVFPLYDPALHGPLTGLNLLKVCGDAGAIELGQKLIERMLQQDWPHIRATLLKSRDGFDRPLDDFLSARYISN